jgi:formate transporter
MKMTGNDSNNIENITPSSQAATGTIDTKNILDEKSTKTNHVDDIECQTTFVPINQRETATTAATTTIPPMMNYIDESQDCSSNRRFPILNQLPSNNTQQQQQQRNNVNNSIKTPKDTLQAVYKAGIYKAELPIHLLCMQSFLAGTYIALAGHIFLVLDGGVLGAIFFPTGLIAVFFTSAELFTGDALVFIASVLGKKVSIFSLLRNWTISWIFNFFGCLVWASILGYASGALESHREYSIELALKKVRPTWIQIFIKAIGANFLVCLGVWQATCAEEAAGKIMAMWFPVAGFVLMGFDHCIANQFLIPMGMMFGADISISRLLFHALLPATLGNVVGGGICIGAVYWYVFDSMGSSIYLQSRIRWHPNMKHHDPKDDEIAVTETVHGESSKTD